MDYVNESYVTKVLDANGNKILENYSNVQAIEKKDLNDVWYDENLLIYENEGLYGLINYSGTKITDAEYTNIYSLDGTSKTIIIEKDGKKGVVNSALENVVFGCEYDDIASLTESTEDDGYIVLKNGKYGLISASGKVILEANYSEIKHTTGNSMYVVNEDGLKIIDSNSATVLDNGFDDVKSIDGENLVIKSGESYGVINTSGITLIQPEYEDLTYATGNYYIAKKDGKYGIVSLDGTICVNFIYETLEYIKTTDFYQGENSDFTSDILNAKFEVKLSNVIVSELNPTENYMRVRENGEYKYYTLNFEETTNVDVLKSNTLFLKKVDGKYGYVNKDGEIIVSCEYDDALEQNQYGYCAVKKDGVWGVYDSTGAKVLDTSVNLDENLEIEFIGKWHKYEGLNIYVK